MRAEPARIALALLLLALATPAARPGPPTPVEPLAAGPGGAAPPPAGVLRGAMPVPRVHRALLTVPGACCPGHPTRWL
jgi:hypothetical protein